VRFRGPRQTSAPTTLVSRQGLIAWLVG
jgi:hypothetical protein